MPTEIIDLLSKNNMVFVENNGIWNIKYYDEFVQLADISGIRYVHYILNHPQKDISLAELYTAINGGSPEELENIIEFSGSISVDTISLKETMKNYENEIKRLLRLIDDTEITGNQAKLNSFRKQIDDIEKEMSRVTRDIIFPNNKYALEREKIRKAIYSAIALFYKKLEKQGANKLLHHLKSQILVYNGYTYIPENDNDKWVLYLEEKK